MTKWIARGVQCGILIDIIGRRTYLYAKGVPAAAGNPATCPLLAAGAGIGVPVHHRVPQTNVLVWMRCYPWGADTFNGAMGPALQVAAVGKAGRLGFVVDHGAFFMQ